MLLTVAHDLQLHIVGFLSDPSDCASLCLAIPRGLGLAALRELPQYKDPLVSVALRLATDDLVVDEALLRRYLWDKRLTPYGCGWMTGAAKKFGSLGIKMSFHAEEGVQQVWRLTDGGREGACVRATVSEPWVPHDWVLLYEGERGGERLARMELPGGQVSHFEGEKGAERLVRTELPDGQVSHYEGEESAELLVRVELPSGQVNHYEGEKLLVRVELPSGQVNHFEGERGAERLVRVQLPDGTDDAAGGLGRVDRL